MDEGKKVIYSPGMRVIIRDEEWKIEKTEINSLGGQTLFAVGLSPLVRGKECRFLPELEREITRVDPAQVRLIPDDSPHFLKTRLYIESQLRRKVPTDDKLHIGWKAAMDALNFQLEPAKLALASLKPRILIADTVGLGKTLEAGILMSELIARGKGRRILVVTVKSMMTQFQKEMWNRFSIPLVRLDSSGIQKIRAELPAHSNPFFYYDRAIISVDTLKRDIEYRTHLENARWDIIVIDEAHNVADRSASGAKESQRAKLAQLLAERSDCLIMLSATPHDGRPRSFASLIRMLDPTAIADPDDYSKDDLKGLFVRRFKKDVADELSSLCPERQMQLVPSQASLEEEAAYQVLSGLKLHMDARKLRARGQSPESGATADLLFKTGLVKSLFSSPAACLKTIENRLRRLDDAEQSAEVVSDRNALRQLHTEVSAISPASFSRYQKLLEILRSQPLNDSGSRVVVFTERIETMKFLAEHIKSDLGLSNDQVVSMSGAMSDVEQQEIVDAFGREASPLRVLVASDVASEGINLHFCCHRLIHFDIPWSIMTLNQRNGRIDRYGQKKNPDIRCLLVQSKNSEIQGDARYLSILVEKEHRVHDNIGDPAALMNAWDPEAEAVIVGRAMEDKTAADQFEMQTFDADPLLSLFEQLLHSSGTDEKKEDPRTEDRTLFSDLDYLTSTIELYNASSPRTPIRYQPLHNAPGIAIAMNDDLIKRMAHAIPREAMPADGVLRVSPDKNYCIDEMNRSRQKEMGEAAWPEVQYLWPLHPVLEWAGDLVAYSHLTVDRSQAPVACLGSLAANETVVLVAGQIPNRRSVAVVDQWTGILFKDSRFAKFLSAEETIQLCHLRESLPNARHLSDEEAEKVRAEYVTQSVDFAEQSTSSAGFDYMRHTAPREKELQSRLETLRLRHQKALEQLTLFESVKSKRMQRIDALFDEHKNWVTDSLSIDAQRPNVRVIAIFTGAEQ